MIAPSASQGGAARVLDDIRARFPWPELAWWAADASCGWLTRRSRGREKIPPPRSKPPSLSPQLRSRSDDLRTVVLRVRLTRVAIMKR